MAEVRNAQVTWPGDRGPGGGTVAAGGLGGARGRGGAGPPGAALAGAGR